MRTIYLVLIAVASGALGARLLGGVPTLDPAPANAGTTALMAPRASPAHVDHALATELRDLADRQDELEADVDDLWASAAPPEPADDPIEASEAREQVLIDLLARTIEQQTPDPTWAPAAEGTIHAWANDYHGASLKDADCKADLCRFTLSFPEIRARAEGMSNMPLEGPWSGQGYAHALSTDGLTYEVYLAREGSVLPES